MRKILFKTRMSKNKLVENPSVDRMVSCPVTASRDVQETSSYQNEQTTLL